MLDNLTLTIPDVITIRLDAAPELVAALAGYLDALTRALLASLGPGRPGRFTLAVTGQAGASTMILTATMPARTAPDVASYELSYTIDGGTPTVATGTGGPITFNAPAGSTVVATVLEIDATGNRGEPSDPITLVVTDNVPPPKAGTFGLSVTGQEAMPDPAAVLAAGS